MASYQSTQPLLAAVRAEQLRFNQPQQAALPPAALQAFQARVAATLAYELPPVYCAILAVADGLDWNGTVLYGSETQLRETGELASQGLLEANLLLRLAYTPDKDFIYFAESGLEAYRHNLGSDQFEVADRIAADAVFETFPTAEELFTYMLQDMLATGHAAANAAF